MTKFVPIACDQESISWLMSEKRHSLVITSLSGHGDGVFLSPFFADIKNNFKHLFFYTTVNAYSTIWHESPYIKPLYAGGVNGNDHNLGAVNGFANHFLNSGFSLDGITESFIYLYGWFDMNLSYNDPKGYTKGRRYGVEFLGTGPDSTETPKYHVAPDRAPKQYIDTVIDRWLPGREIISICRYGHTDVGKNFGDNYKDSLQLIDILDSNFPGKFKYILFDYTPGAHAGDGKRYNVRSVYGFLPCDAASQYWILYKSSYFVTVPTGPMVLAASIPHLKLVTLWKTAKPYHFLDPQFPNNRVIAICGTKSIATINFTYNWTEKQKDALLSNWHIKCCPITPLNVAKIIIDSINNTDTCVIPKKPVNLRIF